MPRTKNLLSRDVVRAEARRLNWLDKTPTFKRVGKDGVVIEWSWRVSKTKKLFLRKIGHSRGSCAIYTLAKKEIENGQRT